MTYYVSTCLYLRSVETLCERVLGSVLKTKNKKHTHKKTKQKTNKKTKKQSLITLNVPGPISQNRDIYSNDTSSPKKSWFQICS